MRTKSERCADRRSTRRPLYRRLREDKGYVLAMTGMMLVPLLAFTAMAVDLGSWYAQATRMQRAADAAALAGVVWAADDSIDGSCTPAVQHWMCVATQTATKNGMDATSSATVTVTKLTDARIEVKIGKAGALYFGKLFLSGENLTRRAQAEYVTPVPMGSPLPSLGNDPDHPGTVTPENPGGQPQFWLNIAGPKSGKGSGDRFTSNNCSTGQWGCTLPPANSEYKPDGYTFKVSVAATNGSPLNISVFDPAFTNTGDFCDNATNIANPVSPALAAAYPSAADNAAFRYLGSSTSGYCSGDNDVNAANVVTSYIVRAPDGTPLDSTDNPAICAISFSPEDQSINNLLLGAGGAASTTKYGLEKQLFASHFHKDFTICKVTTPVAGDYIVQVRTNALNPGTVPPTTTANTRAAFATSVSATVGRADTTVATGGHNRYTIQGFWGATCCGSTAGITTAAEGRLPMYVNVTPPTTATFYLAKITPQYAGKILQLQFWDIADGGTAAIEILPPTETPLAVKPTACTWSRDGLADLGAAVATGCKVTNMKTGDYNAKLVQVTIPLPVGYTCTASTGCWFKIAYTFVNATDKPNDTTTWSASILGDPVHLTL